MNPGVNNAPTQNVGTYTQLRNKSMFNHKIQDIRYVDVFKKLVTNDLEILKIKKIITGIRLY